MKWIITSALIIGSLLLPVASAQEPVPALGTEEGPSAPPPRFHTRVTLLADVASIRPGVPFTAGVLLHMDPGWHTYWENPGETGLPTQIHWSLPPGFVAGPIQWPLPAKHIESGNILTFGYDNETMLLVSITPPASLHPGTPARLGAKVSWLECERLCVPGNATVDLRIPVSKKTPAKDNAPLFDRYRSLLPRPYESNDEISVASTLAGRSVTLHVSPRGSTTFAPGAEDAVDFYPGPPGPISAGRSEISTAAGGEIVRLPLSRLDSSAGASVLRGIVTYRLQTGERRSVALEIPLPSEFCAALPLAGAPEPSGGLLDRSFVTDQNSGRQPLLLFLAFALLGGLLLNIMPCVLPVIALKIFGLVKMAGDHPGRIKRLGWFFSLGILASFLVLALFVIILQAAGQQVGWGFQFQEPLFVVAMCAVVFAFGLSLFGVFEIQLPSAAVMGVSGIVARQQGRTGYAASFWEGVFATILATPCTAPFLGSALGFAFAQPPPVIVLMFAIVALGMALPYLILTAKPAWLKFLPKPGEWMVTAKQFMGFLMMATLLWLLYVLGKQLGMESVIWTGAFLLAVGVACWLVGRFATLTASRARFAITWVAAIILVVLGYYVFLESALDIRSVIAGVPGSTESVGTNPEGIQWKPFSVAGVESALNDEKPLFIDFTAEWCLTCKVNEHSVLTDQRVVEKFRTSNITAVRADWTNRNPDITKLLARFGRSGVPLYVIFPAGKPDAPIVLPEVITTSMVIDAIDRATGGSSMLVRPQ